MYHRFAIGVFLEKLMVREWPPLYGKLSTRHVFQVYPTHGSQYAQVSDRVGRGEYVVDVASDKDDGNKKMRCGARMTASIRLPGRHEKTSQGNRHLDGKCT